MRIGIFFFSLHPAIDRQPVCLGEALTPVGYVRVEQVEAADTSEALGMGTMRPDETLMNTHALDAKDWHRQ